MKQLVSIFKTPKKEGMYLYVLKNEQMQQVPESLQAVFTQPQHVMDVLLTPERQLAQASAEQVLQALQTTGYYLQMPLQNDGFIEHLPDELLTLCDPV